jgi:hypothetical protein
MDQPVWGALEPPPVQCTEGGRSMTSMWRQRLVDTRATPGIIRTGERRNSIDPGFTPLWRPDPTVRITWKAGVAYRRLIIRNPKLVFTILTNSIMETNQLILYREILAFFFLESYKTQNYSGGGGMQGLCYVKVGGMYSNHCALKSWPHEILPVVLDGYLRLCGAL